MKIPLCYVLHKQSPFSLIHLQLICRAPTCLSCTAETVIWVRSYVNKLASWIPHVLFLHLLVTAQNLRSDSLRFCAGKKKKNFNIAIQRTTWESKQIIRFSLSLSDE